MVKAVDKCVENRYLNTTTTTTYFNIYPKVRGKEARNFYETVIFIFQSPHKSCLPL